MSHQENHYVIKHDTWNSIIKPDETIKLGFEGKPEAGNSEPQNFKLIQSEQIEDEEEEEKDVWADVDMDNLDLVTDTDIEAFEEIEKSNPNRERPVSNPHGLQKAIDQFALNSTTNGSYIVVISDSATKIEQKLIDQCKKENIKLFCVNIKEKDNMEQMKEMIQKIGGYYYHGSVKENIFSALWHSYNTIKEGVDTKDTDNDGLFDIYEKKGMIVSNGQIEKSNNIKADTDEDEVSDNDEMNASVIYIYYFDKNNFSFTSGM